MLNTMKTAVVKTSRYLGIAARQGAKTAGLGTGLVLLVLEPVIIKAFITAYHRVVRKLTDKGRLG